MYFFQLEWCWLVSHILLLLCSQVIVDYQTHFRLRETHGRDVAEHMNERVMYWSIGEAVVLLVVSIAEVSWKVAFVWHCLAQAGDMCTSARTRAHTPLPPPLRTCPLKNQLLLFWP